MSPLRRRMIEDMTICKLAPKNQHDYVQRVKDPLPQAVLAYLSRYTHRVAIANSRLLAIDDNGVTFKCKDIAPRGHSGPK